MQQIDAATAEALASATDGAGTGEAGEGGRVCRAAAAELGKGGSADPKHVPPPLQLPPAAPAGALIASCPNWLLSFLRAGQQGLLLVLQQVRLCVRCSSGCCSL